MVSPVKNGRRYCCHESTVYSVGCFQIVNLNKIGRKYKIIQLNLRVNL